MTIPKILWTVCLTLLTVSSAHAEGPSVNPFSGNYVEIERTRANIELTKLQAQLADEQTKKATAEYLLTNSDKIAKSTLAAKTKDTSGGQMPAPFFARGDVPAPLPPDAVPQSRAPAKKPVKETKAKPAETPVVQAAPVYTGPILVGVMERGEDRVAVIQSGGTPVNAKVGTTVPGFGVVKEIGLKSVTSTSGQTLNVRNQVSMASVDRQMVGAGGTGAAVAGQMPQGGTGANASGVTLISPPTFAQ